MAEDNNFTIRFNQILHEEMSKIFELHPLFLDPDLKTKQSTKEGKGAVIKSEYLECTKTRGIRIGEMNFA
ncbi:MAG: hypothetical protein KAJ08_05635, partial [Deltaproteobacteria bacterium]|nr:hypothetical protein [Deltaproteobacteria bacterium]